MYSLGCVFFEALTGVPPFQGDNALATINMHANLPTPALSDRNSNRRYSAALEAIVSKCLNKDRDQRFQTMEELLEALNGLNTRTVMTQEIIKPVLVTTGGFILPSNSNIKDPGLGPEGRKQRESYAQTFLGIFIALFIVALATFAINQMMKPSEIGKRTKLESISTF
jgi:serine/threonine-protein kinase